MYNQKFLSFFLGKLLSVNSFEKVNFWISLFTAKSQMFGFHGWLGSQAAIFEFLKINENLFYYVIILYLAKKSRLLAL